MKTLKIIGFALYLVICGIFGFMLSAQAQTLIDLAHQVKGILPAANLPNPSASTIGGVESIAAVSHNFLTSISTSGVPAQARPVCADSSDAAASCSTDATNASNISSGTLGAARLPNPSASTLGGIESIVAATHKWINSISTSGVPNQTQPACADLSDAAASCNTDATNATNLSSGTVGAARMPALTGDVTTSAGAVATTLASVVSASSCGDTTHSCGLTYDAKGRITAATNNAIAGGSSGTPLLTSRRWAYVTGGDGVGGTFVYVGDFPNLGGSCSGTVNPTSSNPTPLAQCNQGSGAAGGVQGGLLWMTGQNIYFAARGAYSSVTQARQWIGIGDQGRATMAASDTPTGNFAAFRFSTGASDTHYQCASMDNSTMTLSDSGITPTANGQHTFSIKFNDATPNIVYQIDGSTVCTLTTHLPTTNTTLMAFFVGEGTGATLATNPGWYYVEADK